MALYFVNLVLVITSLIINIIASVVILKKKPLKQFQVTFINIIFLNILYAVTRLPTVLINLTSSKHDILQRETFNNFRILIAVFIIHAICFFITFLAFQRLIAVTNPMKFPTWITKRNIMKVSTAIYITITTGFSVSTVLIVKFSIKSVQIDRALCWLLVTESFFIVISYTIIVWKSINFKFRSSITKQEQKLVKISIIVSISFLISYLPITFYLLLEDSPKLFYEIAILMLWIDNFVNPLVIILDNRWAYCICRVITVNDSTDMPATSKVTAKSSLNLSDETAIDSIKSMKITALWNNMIMMSFCIYFLY